MMQPWTVRLEKELHEKLRLEAFLSKKSMNDIVNDALREYLSKKEQERGMTYEDFFRKN